MNRNTLIGAAIGIAVAALSVAGNVWRGDPRLLSAFPDLLAPAALFALMFVVSRQRRTAGWDRSRVLRSGLRAAGVAGVVFAVAFALFVLWWFPRGSMVFVLGSSLMGFFAVVLVGALAVVLSGVRIARVV